MPSPAGAADDRTVVVYCSRGIHVPWLHIPVCLLGHGYYDSCAIHSARSAAARIPIPADWSYMPLCSEPDALHTPEHSTPLPLLLTFLFPAAAELLLVLHCMLRRRVLLQRPTAVQPAPICLAHSRLRWTASSSNSKNVTYHNKYKRSAAVCLSRDATVCIQLGTSECRC